MSWRPVFNRLIVLFVIGALIISSVGCSLPAAQSGPVVLRIAYRPTVADLKPLLAQYQRENPGIVVETFELTGSNFPSLRSELDAGTMDIVREYRYTLYSLARDGTFEPLDSWIESGDWGRITSDYFNGTWEGLQVNGQQFGIPAGLDMYVAYANLTAFNQAGVEPPAEDWTLDDLLTKAAAVHHPEGTPGEDEDIVYGFGTYYMSADPILFTYLHGGALVDDFDHPTAFYLDDPRTVEAITFYTDLVTKYKVALKPTLVSAYFRSGGITTAINQGYCALWFGMFSSRDGGEALFGTPYKWEFDWKMLPLPHDVQQVTIGDVDGYYIPASSSHKQEALKLVRWLADQWQASGTRFQVRRSLAENASYRNQLGADIARIGSLAADNVLVIPLFFGRGGERMLGTFFSAIYQILEKGDDPQMALEKAQQEAEEMLLQGQFEQETATP